MIDYKELLIYSMLFFYLPLWGLAGFVDWLCHKRTHIESTSGIKESVLHAIMGIQIGIPIALCLLFRVNTLILLLCFIAWISHELVAHYDVHYTTPRREISIWETHAHNYLATIPLFLLVQILLVNWNVVQHVAVYGFTDQFEMTRIEDPHGGEDFLPLYTTFMIMSCVAPYVEELYRCFRSARERSR